MGIEWNVGRQFTVNGDVLWMPFMFKKHEEVFRTLIGSIDLRYYVKPKYYYTNNAFDGFYIGPTPCTATSTSAWVQGRGQGELPPQGLGRVGRRVARLQVLPRETLPVWM